MFIHVFCKSSLCVLPILHLAIRNMLAFCKKFLFTSCLFSAVKIRFSGKAYVYWTETETRTTGSGDNRRTEEITHYYTASQNYFNYEVSLYGKGAQIDLFTV